MPHPWIIVYGVNWARSIGQTICYKYQLAFLWKKEFHTCTCMYVQKWPWVSTAHIWSAILSRTQYLVCKIHLTFHFACIGLHDDHMYDRSNSPPSAAWCQIPHLLLLGVKFPTFRCLVSNSPPSAAWYQIPHLPPLGVKFTTLTVV